jgi:hypothetical protein
MMPSESVARELLQTEWAFQNAGIVLPSDHRLFKLSFLTLYRRKRPQKTSTRKALRLTGQQLSQSCESFLQSGDFQKCLVHDLASDGNKILGVISLEAFAMYQ